VPGRRIWLRLPLLPGHLLQLAGMGLGAAAISYAGSLSRGGAALAVAGWVLIYFCCHAIAHWAVGRLAGIRFRFYTVAGTEKPESMPPGLRWLFEHLPFFGVRTEKPTLEQASPWGQALMWSAGVTSSVLAPLLAAAWAWRIGAPGGRWLFFFAVVWGVGTVAANFKPHGDFWKAKKALAGPAGDS
jgi:hypothetical protein